MMPLSSELRKEKKIACVDFDGVINLYNGWVSDDHFPEPRPGAKEFLTEVSKRFRVFILTSRGNHEGIRAWLVLHELSDYIEEITSTKVGAHFYLDDRGIRFNGDFDEVLSIIVDFEPHWKVRT